ncbi:MAG: efflux RND transporter periplasmic adaptor subunit [Planctomycetes bacterium]|nr:efflux RND transporter periplasmic adaptor subunit [Planctomycetota bacterium]
MPSFVFRKSMPVKTTRCTMGPVEETVVASSVGTVEPEQTAVVSAEVSGHVVEIKLRHGRAAQGTPIVLLDRNDLEAEREQMRRDLDASRLRVEQSRLRAEKIEAELHRVRGTDEPLQRIEALEKDLSIARKDIEISAATVRISEAAMHLLELRLAKTAVAAPFDGTLTKLHVEVGESITPGRQLFTFQSNPPFLVRAPMDETDVGRIRVGMAAHVTFDALRDRTFSGELSEIMPAASTDQRNNRTVDVKVRMSEWPEGIVAGMSANLEIVVRRSTADVLRLATPHIREDYTTHSRYVFVLENGVARKRTIKTGLWNWEHTEILDGLSVADPIITDVIDPDRETKLEDGMAVRVVDGN